MFWRLPALCFAMALLALAEVFSATSLISDSEME
jgi:hypothetical protein